MTLKEIRLESLYCDINAMSGYLLEIDAIHFLASNLTLENTNGSK